MPTPSVQIRQALFPADEAAVRALIDEYLSWLDLDLSFRAWTMSWNSWSQSTAPRMASCCWHSRMARRLAAWG